MQIHTPTRTNAMCMLAAIAGIFTSDCDKCVRASSECEHFCYDPQTPTQLALDILFVSAVSILYFSG